MAWSSIIQRLDERHPQETQTHKAQRRLATCEQSYRKWRDGERCPSIDWLMDHRLEMDREVALDFLAQFCAGLPVEVRLTAPRSIPAKSQADQARDLLHAAQALFELACTGKAADCRAAAMELAGMAMALAHC